MLKTNNTLRSDVTINGACEKVPISGFGPDRSSPLKCLCAPNHQILANSAPKKACNRDNAEFATKLRKLSNFKSLCEP